MSNGGVVTRCNENRKNQKKDEKNQEKNTVGKAQPKNRGYVKKI